MSIFQKFKEKILKEDATDLEKENALEAADEWLFNEISKHKTLIRNLTNIQNDIRNDFTYDDLVIHIDQMIDAEVKEINPEERNELTIKALTDLRNSIFQKSL